MVTAVTDRNPTVATGVCLDCVTWPGKGRTSKKSRKILVPARGMLHNNCSDDDSDTSADDFDEDGFINLTDSSAAISSREASYFDQIGSKFLDTDENKTFQIVAVCKSQQHRDQLFFR